MHDDDHDERELISVEAELVEVVPSTRELTEPERPRPPALPMIQAAAVAATGFVAGAAAVALLRRHGQRRLLRLAGELADARGASARTLDPAALGTRTYLVSVRVIPRP
jgi:hypothetical protein